MTNVVSLLQEETQPFLLTAENLMFRKILLCLFRLYVATHARRTPRCFDRRSERTTITWLYAVKHCYQIQQCIATLA